MNRAESEEPLPHAKPPVSAGDGVGFPVGQDELIWRLNKAQALAHMGSWEWNIETGRIIFNER